jgi:transcriptional regulator NrdR family protein
MCARLPVAQAESPKGIRCPHCGSLRHRVRKNKPGDNMERRRMICLSCGKRFNTTERLET